MHNFHVRGHLIAIEVEIARVHSDSSILVPGEPDRIDPDRWQPLIMSFQHFYGLNVPPEAIETRDHPQIGLSLHSSETTNRGLKIRPDRVKFQP